MKTLLVGMGNPILCDDAIGVRLASALKATLCERKDVVVMEECSVGGLNMIEIFAGFDRAIVLDSIKTQGGTPGSLYRFSALDLKDTFHLTNVHDANFSTALELGRRLGTKLPRDEDIHIFAVEVDDNVTFSERMTKTLEGAFDSLLAEVRAQVEGVLG